jgi:alpha-galactosidase
MEAFGHANTLIVPARATWTKGTPLGWNSWGVIMEKINLTNVTEVAQFYKNELFDRGFNNEQGNVVIDLDSFWAEGLSRDNLRTKFATDCKQRGQVPGIYWGPFANWGGLDGTVEETNGQYHFNECTLYANGEPVKLDGGYCLDPTHPAVKERITKMFAKFRSWGYEYIKLDFVNFGAIQADSYYNPEVTTAIQAYNEGFQHLLDAAGDMFISLSIAPTFPYQYGNSRRISCDAWGTIGHTEYVMNALSYGWWTDQFYQYNDPDHVVLQRDGESEGANRARITSAAITGMFLMGDNFSATYTERGNPTVSKDRAIRFATNPDIIKITCLGGSFMPVYGHKTTSTTTAENLFMRRTDDYLYVAGINYSSSMRRVSGTILLDYLGIEASQIESIEEVWTGDPQALKNGEFSYEIPACDARIYKIKFAGSGNGIASSEISGQGVYLSVDKNTVSIQAKQKLINVEVFTLQGQLLAARKADSQQVNVPLPDTISGICLVKCRMENRKVIVKKCIL